jgi:hypothetical protein
MVFTLGCWQQWNRQRQKCRESAGDFDHHVDAAVQCGAHPRWSTSWASLEATRCLHQTSACAVLPQQPPWSMNTLKTHASNYGRNRSLVVYENFIPPKGPSTQLVDATSCVKMCNATIRAEELRYILSYQTLSADKN